MIRVIDVDDRGETGLSGESDRRNDIVGMNIQQDNLGLQSQPAQGARPIGSIYQPIVTPPPPEYSSYFALGASVLTPGPTGAPADFAAA